MTGYYWYGPKKHSEGKVSQWIRDLTKADENDATPTPMDDTGGSKYEEEGPSGLVEDPAMYTRQRDIPDGCPYSLRKEINIPRRYQQAWEEL